MQTLVSIITPVYNAERYLEDHLKSVQEQTYVNWEHFLVDDCSTDNSPTIIKMYQNKDSRIKYVRLKENGGAGVARNKAIQLAQGNYIAFLDSDDKWCPDKLKKQLHFMQKNRYHFTFTSYKIMNAEGIESDKIITCKKMVNYRSALYKNPIGCLTVIYDVGFFGKQYMPQIRKRQDFALWLKLLKKTNGYGLQEPLAIYRSGNESISSNKWKLLSYEWRIYRNVEKLSIPESLFYTLSAVVLKMKSYF